MATSQEVKEAADACEAAKAAFAAAEADVNSKEVAAFALIPNELAARDAALVTFNAALETARATVGWNAANGTYQDALVARDEAVEALVSAAAAYDGS